jgi:CubicO group peptidase (beta-lactamase class C family)
MRSGKRSGVRIVIGGILALIPVSCATAPAGDAERNSPLTANVSGMMEQALVPGLQMAVIDHRQIRVLPFGVADVQSGSLVTSETVFEAASLGKPVLAYAVLKLASEGRIDIDAPVGRYLDGLTAGLEKVTARQLLSHTAGLPNTGSAAPVTLSEPRFSYSGEGIKLLQRVVERITGEPLQEYMESAVFKPLGMSSSSFIWRDDYAIRKAFGHGHTGSSAGRNRIPNAQAASSLETTAGDYARFMIAAVRGQGLDPALAREMLRPQVTLEEGCAVCLDRPRGKLSPHHWGLGLGLEKVGGRTYAWHWGDNSQTMQSYAALDTGGDRGVVILTNSANGHSIARQIASNVLGSDAPGYAWVGSYGAYTDPSRQLLSKIVRSGVASVSTAEIALPASEIGQVAERLLEGGRSTDAAALLRKLITVRPPRADDYALLAEALRRSDQLTEATEAANSALQLEPGHAKANAAIERIQQSQRQIPATDLARFAGRYASPFGPLEVTSDGRRLVARLLDQPPSEMLPLSDRKFLMVSMHVPIEFVAEKNGIISHAVVEAGGEIRLPRLP